jgi:hypothetical protein
MSNLAQFNIDVESEAQEARSFSPLPDGNYPAIVTGSELKDTKAGNGKYLSLAFEVIDGEHKGRKLWTNINIQNPNPTAEKIGRSELANLCKAVGVLAPQTSEELHDIPVILTVRLDKQDATRNAVKGYAPVGDAFEVPVKAEPPKQAPKPATGKKPWQK